MLWNFLKLMLFSTVISVTFFWNSKAEETKFIEPISGLFSVYEVCDLAPKLYVDSCESLTYASKFNFFKLLVFKQWSSLYED